VAPQCACQRISPRSRSCRVFPSVSDRRRDPSNPRPVVLRSGSSGRAGCCRERAGLSLLSNECAGTLVPCDTDPDFSSLSSVPTPRCLAEPLSCCFAPRRLPLHLRSGLRSEAWIAPGARLHALTVTRAPARGRIDRSARCDRLPATGSPERFCRWGETERGCSGPSPVRTRGEARKKARPTAPPCTRPTGFASET
jgi:hypothetical protein